MEFVCADPQATVRAANVTATLAAFRLLPDVGRRLIERHELPVDDLRADRFIPVQRWLDALREIQGAVGPKKVREVGRLIIEKADFPPVFSDAMAILEALDQIYHLNHNGDVGHYRIKRLGPNAIEIRCETPYPKDFEWGLVEGICSHPRANGRYAVEFEPAKKPGDLTCTLIVRKL